MFLQELLTQPYRIQESRCQMMLTSWRAPGSSNTHRTNCHSNEVYQVICLKLFTFVYIKLTVNIRYYDFREIASVLLIKFTKSTNFWLTILTKKSCICENLILAVCVPIKAHILHIV